MFRVMVVDDQESYRRMVRYMLEREEDFRVVADAADGAEALRLMDEVNPDLVIMDVQMPSINGFEATRLIMQGYPNARVVLISRTRRQRDFERMAEEVGAAAFMVKGDLAITAVRQALQS